MNKIYCLLTLLLIGITKVSAQGSIKGLLQDDLSDEVIIVATVKLYQSDKLVKEIYSDFDGYFLFEELSKGTYSIVVSYTGYQDYKDNDIEVRDGKITEVNYRMVYAELEEMVITSHHPWRFIEETKRVKKEQSVVSPPIVSGPAITEGREIGLKIRGSRESAIYNPSGIRIANSEMKIAPSLSGSISSGTFPIGYDNDVPVSGQMTAGEWNDLHNWEDWNALLKEENYRVMYRVWGISTDERYSVFVKNDLDLPLANVTVELRDPSDNLIWISRTDKSGKAELWANVFSQRQLADRIVIKSGDYIKTYKDLKPVSKGSNTITLKRECEDISMLDISFMVDATSSMLDEIDYLKSELGDVIQRTQEINDQLDIRLSSIFYRDEGDDYVTRSLPFTSDISKVESFVNDQYAQGGGDIPEALHQALSKAVSLEWRDEAVKLIFVILDAPAHQSPEVLEDLYRSIEEASKQGIKIIPVTASDLERNAEFLMKYMAMLTNGTYVFITDDSGIGNAHLDPVVDDYEVEKLNDLMVRLITSYSEETQCELLPVVEANELDWSVFPNPTVQKITVTHSQIPELITVHSNSGQTLMSIQDFGDGSTEIDLGNLVAGTYFVYVRSGERVERKKVILIR